MQLQKKAKKKSRQTKTSGDENITKKPSKKTEAVKKGKKKEDSEKKTNKKAEEVETIAIVYDIKDDKNFFYHLDGVPDSIAIENLIDFDRNRV